MNKNTVIAIVLSFLVVFTWTQITNKNQKSSQSKTGNAEKVEIQPVRSSIISQGQPESILKTVGQEPVLSQTFILENNASKIIFGAKGEMQSFLVKEKNGSLTDLVYSAKSFPLTVNPSIIYTTSETMERPNGEALVLNGMIDDKVSVRTSYNYLNDQGLVAVSLELTNISPLSLHIENFKVGLGPGINTSEEVSEKVMMRDMKGFYYSAGELTKKPKIGRSSGIQNGWIAVTNHYFISAIIDSNNIFEEVQVTNKKLPELFLSTDLRLDVGETKTLNFQTLWGIKNYDYLTSLDNDLHKTISLGIFAPLGKLIMWLLAKFYEMTGNYGIAIILLTTIMQLILLPLNKKSFESMHKLKKVQPKLEKLKKKYKDNPQNLNMEMMALYKREKVNPFGGCLPILLQLPIFWALFTVLRNATELRYAPFLLWINDLSKPDTVAVLFGVPINILPILMGGMMFVSQKLNTGQTSDPMQAKMLTFMPIMFLFMFWNFPSGLVLYWLFSNIYTVCLNLYLTVKNKEA
ncbi:MAG: membrane protein insertase YidC [bacterium]|nr:membrane protein insertase YidC [bacterium]